MRFTSNQQDLTDREAWEGHVHSWRSPSGQNAGTVPQLPSSSLLLPSQLTFSRIAWAILEKTSLVSLPLPLCLTAWKGRFRMVTQDDKMPTTTNKISVRRFFGSQYPSCFCFPTCVGGLMVQSGCHCSSHHASEPGSTKKKKEGTRRKPFYRWHVPLSITFLWSSLVLFICLFVFKATPKAYGSSQARG